MRWFFVLSVFCFFTCCSKRPAQVRVGVDPTWSPLSFEELQPYVNGYTEEVLQEVSHYAGLEIDKVTVGWDNLLQGLDENRYEAVLCSLPPYNFNQAKYDFTENFLQLGPVLITPANAHYTHLSQMSGELVGVISSDPAVLFVEKYTEVIIRNYNTIPEVLGAVADGEIEAAVLDRLPASNYVRDLYAGKLKIASAPMGELGLHAICLKNHSPKFIRAFNNSLEQMKKKKSLESLQKKWSL